MSTSVVFVVILAEIGFVVTRVTIGSTLNVWMYQLALWLVWNGIVPTVFININTEYYCVPRAIHQNYIQLLYSSVFVRWFWHLQVVLFCKVCLLASNNWTNCPIFGRKTFVPKLVPLSNKWYIQVVLYSKYIQSNI